MILGRANSVLSYFWAVGVDRKALHPYVFPNTGQQVAVGQIACVPAWELMHDVSQYLDPDTFDGHRFIQTQQSRTSRPSDDGMRGTTLTDASMHFPINLGSWLEKLVSH